MDRNVGVITCGLIVAGIAYGQRAMTENATSYPAGDRNLPSDHDRVCVRHQRAELPTPGRSGPEHDRARLCRHGNLRDPRERGDQSPAQLPDRHLRRRGAAHRDEPRRRDVGRHRDTHQGHRSDRRRVRSDRGVLRHLRRRLAGPRDGDSRRRRSDRSGQGLAVDRRQRRSSAGISESEQGRDSGAAAHLAGLPRDP